MARPLRKCLPDVTYECFSRCIEIRELLAPSFVKDIAVKVLNAAVERYDFDINHLSFENDCFKLIIHTKKNGETISRIMQYIKARIAERFNRAVGRTGPFWNERFSCVIIEESDDPVGVFFNTVFANEYRLVKRGIVSDPRESIYGVIRVYLEEKFLPKVKITLHRYFMELGDCFEERVNRFLAYENRYLHEYSV